MGKERFTVEQLEDGSTLLDCGIGACPVVKHVNDGYEISSTLNPNVVLFFKEEEWQTLKEAILAGEV